MNKLNWFTCLFLGSVLLAPLFCSADDKNILVLDCTNSAVASELTNKFPVVYQADKAFDPSRFSKKGEISQADFGTLTQKGLRSAKGTLRFKIRKDELVDVYIVTSVRMDTFEQTAAGAPPPAVWLSDPITFVASNSSRSSRPVTTASLPITFSVVRTARFLLKEQQRPTSLESGRDAKASAVFGVTFKESMVPFPGPEGPPPPRKVYYYYRQEYKLKFENSLLSLSFEDQSGNQENVATVLTGASDNWFITAGSPLYAYNPSTNDSGGIPTGLYLGFNWTPNDVFDPGARLLIVNFLDVNTINPASAIGLVGLGMGFPKTSNFIPLSTLSVTEILVYNLNSDKFQFLTMINYDVGDILQFLKL